MDQPAGSPPFSGASSSCRSSAQRAVCPASPSAKGLEPDGSPRSPLALDAAVSPRSNPLEHIIVTDSPPHKQLQVGCCLETFHGPK
jgi:hypothetical protein